MKATATGVATMLLTDVFPGRTNAQDAGAKVQVITYPRVAIAKVSDLTADKPLEFNYPSSDAANSNCLLFKLGKPAGGGVGDDADIVAFSARCTHMGGDMSGGFVQEHSVLGCGEHLSTFDLTRHGILVAGHATDRLSQIILEIAEDQIFATGVVGLFYGYSVNPAAINVQESK